MKILETQNAVLTNYEVWQHAVDQKKRSKQTRRREPRAYGTVMRELRSWLELYPSPLSQKPVTYKPNSIQTLLERLRPFDLSKGEVVMIINLRPSSLAALAVMVEELAERFTEEQQEELLTIISDVLGAFPPPPDAEEEEGGAEAAEGEGDVTMQDGDEAPAA